MQALQNAGMPLPQIQNVRALVDTGASHTCLDPSVFAALGLQPTGTTQVITPTTGSVPVNADTYDVSILIPAGNQQPFVRPNMAVSSSVLLHQGFHALLGRDILKHCILHYNGSGQLFTVAY
jgi:predicted aspartyl protease